MGKAEKLREITEEWSTGSILMAINEEIQATQSVEERLELLIFKCEILEFSSHGKVFKVG
ncbi:hypothetical protein [Virgibacillus ndiopensis]|uniref:hypothetical protein n=1 Tax=Virgibacillus ndiopensis TaxID=2004408 RepID=UPI000C06CF70|nr:hypothetical protein [Virgibacillus ndiopensis]